jgi:iron complex transport system substrate-binding protein
MTRHTTLVLAGTLFLATSASLCAQKVVRDDLGYEFRLSGGAPQRIVSLAPNVTEILFALGLDREIIGVTRYCDYPPQALAKEKIGGLIDPDLEKIRALNPDLVIAFRGNPLPVIRRLRGLGVPVFVLEEGITLASVFSFLEKIGKVTGREDEASALADGLRARSRVVEAALRDIRSRPRVFLSLHGAGFWTTGRHSYLHDLIVQAGGINVAGHVEKRWVNYGRERLLEDRPDIFVILVKTARDFGPARDWLAGQAFLQSLPAIREGRISPLDENMTSRYGPRLFDALEELARILHPGLKLGQREAVPGGAGAHII